MAKKKTIDIKANPVAVEPGDVNISYNNVLIGSMSESETAVLQTENTKVLHDIEVEYVKPQTSPSYGSYLVNAVHTEDPESFAPIFTYTIPSEHIDLIQSIQIPASNTIEWSNLESGHATGSLTYNRQQKKLTLFTHSTQSGDEETTVAEYERINDSFGKFEFKFHSMASDTSLMPSTLQFNWIE